MRAAKDKERSRWTAHRVLGHRHKRDCNPLAALRTSAAGSYAAAAAGAVTAVSHKVQHNPAEGQDSARAGREVDLPVEEALIPAVRRTDCVVVAGHTSGSEVAAGRMTALAGLAEEGTSCGAAVVPVVEGMSCYVAAALAAEDIGCDSGAGPEPGDLKQETDRTEYRSAAVMMAAGRMWVVPSHCSLLTALN